MAAPRSPVSAVLLDRWPLVRIGMRRAVEEAGFGSVGEGDDIAEGLEIQRRSGAGLLVIGDVGEASPAMLRRASAVAVLVVLVGRARRQDLVGLFDAGVSGVGLRSVSAGDLASLLRRACAGERALTPALLPVLVDRDGVGPAPVSVADVDVRPTREAAELTGKERKVLVALAAGSTNSEIAAQLFVSPATVKTHLAHIYVKLQVSGRHEALSRAVALGLVH